MWGCIIRDIRNTFCFLPMAFVAGLIVYGVCLLVSKRKGKDESWSCFHDVWYGLLAAYFVLLFRIVFFSREAGSRTDLNLVIGGTWTQDSQGRAYVIENILLFIPFGMLMPLCLKKVPIWGMTLIGFSLSLCIEILQLLTARGYFQTDDLIMNTFGCLSGACLVRGFLWIYTYKTGGRNEE